MNSILTNWIRSITKHLSQPGIAILVVFSTWLVITPLTHSDVFVFENLIEFEKLYATSLKSNEAVPSGEFMITAMIEINKQSILDQSLIGSNVHDAWFTVNGQKYDDIEYDMSDAIWNDDAEATDIKTEPLEKTLILPDAGQYEICLEDDGEYKSCQLLPYQSARSETINFLYPASTSSTGERSETAGDPIAEDQNNRYYDGFDWLGVCNNPLASDYITQSCEVLVTSDGNALTLEGKQEMESFLCPRGSSIIGLIEFFYKSIPDNLEDELANACGWT